MSGFRTRLDYSDNRQIKQYEKTNTLLSGATTFGLPFSALTSGPDLTTTGITNSYGLVLSTFSGNGTTTIFTWYDSNMQIAETYVSAITPSNSAITQDIPQVYVGNTLSTLDGNNFYLDYTGVTFDLIIDYIVDLGGAYSGTAHHTYVDILSASSLDYSGRTIWIENPEITKTNRLIIERDAQTNYVWTCIDSEGMGAWLPNSSGGTDNIWTAGTNVSSAVLSGSNSTASGQYAVAQGYQTLASGFASHAEGSGTTASGSSSHAGGSSSSVNSDYSFIHSFNSNIYTNSDYSSILGGDSNTVINSAYSSIIGGELNTISGHTHSFIGGGYNNLIACDAKYNAIIGGQNNLNHASNGVIIGGTNNILGSDPLCPSTADNGVIIGGALNFIDSNTNDTLQSIIIGGFNNRIDSTNGAVDNTVILGGTNITATTSNTVYTPNLIVNTGGTSSRLGINTNNPTYTIDAYGDSNSRIYYDGVSAGGQIALSATTGLPRFGIVSNSGSTFNAGQTSTLSFGVRAWDDTLYSVYGKKGDAFIYGSIYTNGINIISNDGTASSGEDYIRFYAGQSTGTNNGTNAADIHIQGTGATRGYIGFNTNTPTKQIDVNGNGRFRSIGSDVSSNVSLYVTSDGTLSLSASDERLKTNIKQIDNSLDIINRLNGVYYNWKEGDDLTHVGFIAQEVNKVIPELTYVNKNTEEKYMGVHYQNMTAVIVEAIKELYFKLNNNDFLNTQTILAEDNNIDLNYNGNHETSLGGGIRILHGKSDDNHSELLINENGDFITNNNFIPKELTIPYYTPSSSEDNYGSEGNISRDDEYLYIKTKNGWLRTNLDKF